VGKNLGKKGKKPTIVQNRNNSKTSGRTRGKKRKKGAKGVRKPRNHYMREEPKPGRGKLVLVTINRLRLWVLRQVGKVVHEGGKKNIKLRRARVVAWAWLKHGAGEKCKADRRKKIREGQG